MFIPFCRRTSSPTLSRVCIICVLVLLCGTALARSTTAQPAPADALTITKIDPPNWFAALPKPMLLVHGTGLGCARFTVSDGSIAADRVEPSANGHWAQVYLSAAPAAPETVTLRASCPGGEHAELPYTFAARRTPGSGMAGFSPRDVIYLIMTDRFADGDLHNDGVTANDAATSPAAIAQRASPRGWHGGDLRGIEQHLDYLQQLGVSAVWTTPVYQNHSPVAYHGYHATDYYAVDEHYGTLADLQSLAAALHQRGMKLILDTVPNHTGPLHPWVRDEPAADWFHGTAAQHIAAQSDFDALINPHAAARDRVATLDGWFVNELPDNDTDSAAVELYQRQNAIWWIEETGADGLRIDTFPYVDRPFWNAFNGELKQLYPHLTEVGEISSGDPEITSAFADGVTRSGVDTRLYTPFDFPFFYAAADIFSRHAPFTRLTRLLESDELYPHPERLVTFLGNHDQRRLATVVPDPTARQIAWALLLTTRGTPQLYAGDEIALQGGADPDNRSDFPGGFPGDPANAFTPAGRTPGQQREFDWVHDLLNLRHRYAPLACGQEQLLAGNDDTFVYARYGAGACADLAPAEQKEGAARVPEALIVVLQRGATAPTTIDLKGTALAGCRSASVISGHATVHGESQQLLVRPDTPFTLLGCARN